MIGFPTEDVFEFDQAVSAVLAEHSGAPTSSIGDCRFGSVNKVELYRL